MLIVATMVLATRRRESPRPVRQISLTPSSEATLSNSVGSELEPQGLPATQTPRPEELAKLALTKAMKSFGVRTARALNAHWGRKGRVWKERYHVVEITSPLQMRRALQYVLHNGHKHGVCRTPIDSCSSGPYFEFWEKPILHPEEPREAWPVLEPRTWLARVGWKRHGLIPFPVAG